MTRQTSFAAGELAPALHGRTDFALYGQGARRLRDFVVNSLGNADSRPSTLHVGPTRYSADVTKPARLVRFLYAGADGEELGHELEFGPLYVRTPPAAGSVDVVTPYTAAQLSRLKFTQSGDVLYITHPEHTPYLLRRTTATTWSFTAIDFSRPSIYLADATKPPRLIDSPFPVADATHPAREWAWQVTSVTRGADGLPIESLPFTVTEQLDSAATVVTPAGKQWAVYLDRRLDLFWGTGTDALGPSFIRYNIYRGRAGLFGYVGESSFEGFSDLGEEPDFSVQPPQARNPFEVRDAANTVTGYSYPAACALFGQRLVFADANGFVWASRVGDYYNFDKHELAPPDALLELELASRKREGLRWLLGLRQLLVGTSASSWSAGSGDGSLSLQAAVQSEVGSSYLDPLVVGNDVLYVRTKGSGVCAMRYSTEGGGYANADVSLLSRHFFDGYTLVDWCLQEDPHNIVWAVRSDGALLSLTYNPASEVAAWTRHAVNGSVESVCSVPEGDEDVVCLVVRRENGRFIERLASRRLALVEDEDGELVADPLHCFSLDSAVSLAVELEEPAVQAVSVPHLADGTEVWAVADGSVVGPLTVAGGEVSVLGNVLHVGVRFQPEFESLDVPTRDAASRTRPKIVESVAVEVLASRGFRVGETFEKMHPWKQRQVADGFGPVPYETGLAEVTIAGKWNTGARVCLRQEEPLPLTLLAINRKVASGGD